jgi:hypothetical protein
MLPTETEGMSARERTAGLPVAPVDVTRTRRRRVGALIGGGTDGNALLTSMTGAVLIVLLAVLGITILRIHQLIWLHLFLGLVLLGPITIKMASTGYRFLRYYTRNPAYRSKGPPEPLMRLTAPIVVASTLVVFATGILLLIAGPSGRGQYLFLHRASFVIWLAVTAVHVLDHLVDLRRSLLPTHKPSALSGSSPGAVGRWLALAGALIGGLVLAIALTPQFAPWTANAAFLHHH